MSDEAKVLTTSDAKALPEHGDEDGGMPGVVLVDRDDLLATTRALETAQTALVIAASRADEARQADARYAASLLGQLKCAERERDEARAEVERRDALISRDGYEDMRQHAADLAQRLETAERERDAARATVAELVTALADLTVRLHQARSALAKAKGTK